MSKAGKIIYPYKFSVQYFDETVDEDYKEPLVEVSWNNYEFALAGHPNKFELIISELLKEIKKKQMEAV